MKGSEQNASCLFRRVTVWIAILCSVSSRADSWLPPSEFDTLSENGKFIAQVIPGKTSKPKLIVSSIDTLNTNEHWRTELCNDVSPSKVWISDSGSSIVTADNWGGGGYGDDVVAIYNKAGLLTKYSLEQIAPPSKAQKNAPEGYLDRQAYKDKFIHSTSSRHWRENSIEFFYQKADQWLFCLWLDWENRWVVWRMSDGHLISVSSDTVERFNVEGRRRALNQAKSDRSVAAALNFLGRLHFKEDRPLIEAWLLDAHFATGSMQSFSSGNSNLDFAYVARSYKRETADKILSRWDGKASNDFKFGTLDKYQSLGILKCIVAFTTPPSKKDGTIRLYLIPEIISLNEWTSAQPTQYSIADLSGSYPEGDHGRNGHLSRLVNFTIYGITPGSYRMKAVWDKAAPFAKENEIVCQPQAGDYESTTSPVVSIRKGLTTEGAQIECKDLVKK